MIEDQDPAQGSPDDPAAPSSDTGTSAPVIDWEADDNPYKKRFNDYRPEADRKISRLSQYEQAVQDFRSGDPEEMRRAAAVLGISEHLEIDDPEPDYDQDGSFVSRAEFEELKAQQSARDEADQVARAEAIVVSRLKELKGLDDADRDLVFAQACQMPPGEDNLPDIQAAYKLLVARDQARIKQHEEAWRNGKRAPSSIQPGVEATPQKNIAEMTDKDGNLTNEGLEYLANRHEMA